MNSTEQRSELQLWGGVECTVNRVGDHYFDQLARNGHASRIEDLQIFAEIGIKKLRYPVLWEKVAPDALDECHWEWTDERLHRIADLGMDAIAGLVHHGSGPRYTNLLDPEFPEKLAKFAGQVAARYPHLELYTPVNEPLTTARFSCLYGHWFPHTQSDRCFLQALLNECRGTVLAMRAIREHSPAAKLVQTEDLGFIQSTSKLSYQAQFENHRRWLTWDLLMGKVDEDHALWKYFMRNGIEPEQVLWFQENPYAPDVVGINYYITSERFLDHNFRNFPSWLRGGNGRHRYADVETVRVEAAELVGPQTLIAEAWERYGRPIAITEAHLGCTREEQCRWLRYVWEEALSSKKEGADVRAVTVWSLLGSYDWNTLLTQDMGNYESGAFDVRRGRPRTTALAREAALLGSGVSLPRREKGWWERPIRSLYPTDLSRPPVDREEYVNGSSPILIVGATGTLGRAFARACELRGLTYRLTTRRDLDIASEGSVHSALDRYQPHSVINAAGYVRVDDAENDEARCFRENTLGPINLAKACASLGVRLVTFSSDLVFDGTKGAPYVESDPPRPLNIYGQTKAAAEQGVLDAMPSALVLRTSAFFGPWDKYNFAHDVVQHLRAGREFFALEDQYVSPTYVPDLVHCTLDLMQDQEAGIWHLANKGCMSWAEFAAAIARVFGFDPRLVVPIATTDKGAKMPAYSVLGSERGSAMHAIEHAIIKLRDELELTARAMEIGLHEVAAATYLA